MYHFWDTVIEPALDLLQPGVVVEIGSDYGPNTRKLLEFCQKTGAKLHVIDPAPKYDVEEWNSQYGDNVDFHLSLSLEALPKIEDFDAVLIDGDHNWYTVFNELKLIEDRCKADARPFPLVMLHDIGWPYGRRDSYYDPDNVPEDHRQPYDRKGMRPGITEFVEEGGLNRGFPNALHEGGPRNGVLTAVEDFLDQSEQKIELVQVQGIYGLGILVPEHVRASIDGLLKALDPSPNIAQHIDRIEEARLYSEIERQENEAELRRLRNRRERELENLRNSHQKQVAALQEQNRELRQRLQRLRRGDVPVDGQT